MKNNQSGFTLIELVVVIVILGILAVTALPRFVDLSGDARQAAADGVAGALGSASSINYSTAVARGATGPLAGISPVTQGVQDTGAGCTDGVAQNLLTAGGVTFGPGAGNYTIGGASGAGTLATIGATTPCTVTHNDDATAVSNFTLIGAR